MKFALSKIRRFQKLKVRKSLKVRKFEGLEFEKLASDSICGLWLHEVARLRVRRFQTSKGFNFEGLNVSKIEKFEKDERSEKFAKFEGLKRVEMESSRVRRVSSSKV